MKHHFESFAIGSAIMLSGCASNLHHQSDPKDSTAKQVEERFETSQVQTPPPTEEPENKPPYIQEPAFIGPEESDPLAHVTPHAVTVYTRMCAAAVESERVFSEELNGEPAQSCFEIIIRRDRIIDLLQRCLRLTIPGVEYKVTDPKIKEQLDLVRLHLVPLVEELKKLNENPCVRKVPKQREQI